MEFCLDETNVFDEALDRKVEDVIVANKDRFVNDKDYVLELSFHVELLNDSRFNTFFPLHCNEAIKKVDDKIHKVLSWQLNKVCAVLEKQGINSYRNTIQGVELDKLDSIRIVLIEETKLAEEPVKKRKSKRMKVNSIMPNRKATQKRMNHAVNDYMNSRFLELYHILQDNKILMSYLLEIEPTDDINTLYSVFCETYGNLLFLTTEEDKKSRHLIYEKAKKAVDRYVKENNL